MANFFKELQNRIKIDWLEWRDYRTSVWNIKRDKKAIERAIERARLKNRGDGKTYYILRNLGGGFDEINSIGLQRLKLRKVKYFPKYRDYAEMLTQCFAVVTSSEIKRQSYIETVHNIQMKEQTLNDSKGKNI